MSSQLEAAIDRAARSNHGLITYAEAVEILGRSRFRRWVSSGRLIRVQPGVYRVAGSPRTWHQEVNAARLSCRGLVSHRSAGVLWNVIDRDDAVEVSVAGSAAPRLWPPAIGHRIKDLPQAHIVIREGLPVTDPIRTVIDLGLVLPPPLVDDALGRAVSSKLFPLAAAIRLRDALGRPGRNGTGVMRELLDQRLLRGDPDANAIESRLGGLLSRRGIPLPHFQYEVWHEGFFVARVDAAYPELRLAIETDGFGSHSSPHAFQHDRSRQNQLAVLGWTILRFTWHDVTRQPGHVARTVIEARTRLAA